MACTSPPAVESLRWVGRLPKGTTSMAVSFDMAATFEAVAAPVAKRSTQTLERRQFNDCATARSRCRGTEPAPGGCLQRGVAQRRGLRRRSCKQAGVPRHSRRLARTGQPGGRRSARRCCERRYQQETTRQGSSKAIPKLPAWCTAPWRSSRRSSAVTRVELWRHCDDARSARMRSSD